MNSGRWAWCQHCMDRTDHILQDGWRCTGCGNLNSQISVSLFHKKEKKDDKRPNGPNATKES